MIVKDDKVFNAEQMKIYAGIMKAVENGKMSDILPVVTFVQHLILTTLTDVLKGDKPNGS